MSNDFSKQMLEFLALCGERAEQVCRKTALDTYKAIDKRSPVDEGTFRGNNNVALNRDDDTKYDADFYGIQAQARANSAINSFKLGDIVNITNGLPYARVIEYGEFNKPKGRRKGRTFAKSEDNQKPQRVDTGSKTINGFSTQAPQGVYRITATELKGYLEKQIRKIKV